MITVGGVIAAKRPHDARNFPAIVIRIGEDGVFIPPNGQNSYGP